MNDDEFVRKVLNFYEEEGRTFSWRETEDPYSVLVVEILLIKTQAEQVEPIYKNLTAEYPTAEDLARASPGKIGEITDVLGLSYRKKHLHKMAKSLVNDFNSEVPCDLDKLLELYGVGRYVANAVLCFAFGRPRPIVDVNTSRILSEAFGIKTNERPRDSEKLWSKAGELVPDQKCKEYNWGLLDLGAKTSPRKKGEKTVKGVLSRY